MRLLIAHMWILKWLPPLKSQAPASQLSVLSSFWNFDSFMKSINKLFSLSVKKSQTLWHWRKAQLFKQIVDVLYHLVDVHKELFVVDKFILIIRREKLEQMLPSITVYASQ